MTRDVLAELDARAPRRILEDLATLARALAKVDRPRPEVELFLTTGQVVRGRVIDVGDDRNVGIAIIQLGGQRDLGVMFVRVDQIAAIGIGDASLLVQGVISDAPVPSRLELARQLAAKRDGLADKLGRAIAIETSIDVLDDDGRRTVALVLPIACDVLGAIAADEMGKLALAAITIVELGAATSSEVWKDGGKLVVHTSTLVTEAFTGATLRTAIERVL